MSQQRLSLEGLLASPSPEQFLEEGPPGGVDLLTHAEISAEVAEGSQPINTILAQHELTDEAWLKATLFWMNRLGKDAMENGARATLALAYSEAFTKRQDALKPVPEMRPSEWAALTVEMQSGAEPGRVLARRNLSQADFARLNRYFAKRLPRDPLANDEFLRTYNSLQPSE